MNVGVDLSKGGDRTVGSLVSFRGEQRRVVWVDELVSLGDQFSRAGAAMAAALAPMIETWQRLADRLQPPPMNRERFRAIGHALQEKRRAQRRKAL